MTTKTSGASRSNGFPLAAVLAAVGLAALGTPARGEIASLVSATGQSVADDPARVGPVLTPADQPQLSSGDRDTAEAIASSDPRLKRLLDGRDYSFVESGPWTTVHGASQLGAFLKLRLSSPATLHGSWPTMAYNAAAEGSGRPYSTSDADLQADGVTDLLVLVSLRAGRLVAVMPGPGAHVVPGPGEHPHAPTIAD